MREFRAWTGKKMLWRGLHDRNWYGTECNDEGGCHCVQGTHPNDRSKFKTMQFTGLKDSHDKKIYEGDILNVGNKAVIEFRNGRFHPVYDKGMAEDMEDPFWLFNKEVVVIGNIYEHPELLAEEESK